VVGGGERQPRRPHQEQRRHAGGEEGGLGGCWR
jgi:hypothetical protein